MVNRRDFNSGLVRLGGALAVAMMTSPGAAQPACAGTLTEQDLRDYLAAFNRSDFEGFGRFYAHDILFEGQGGTFRSREEVLAFYREVKSRVRETVTLNDVVVGEGNMLADLTTELVAMRDFPGLASGALRQGETRRSQNFVWYQFRGREFVHVRSARYRRL